jgi:phage N-6-adenine-methyltransferase
MEAIKSSAWEVIHSSKNDCWRTPPKLFGSLDNEFSFELDAAATEENKLCQNYLSPLEDALGRSWDAPGAVFCNPPYGRDVGKWVEKAWQESRKRKEPIVLLVMACTDTVWWHDHAWKAVKLPRRLRVPLSLCSGGMFLLMDGQAAQGLSLGIQNETGATWFKSCRPKIYFFLGRRLPSF